MNWTHWNIDCLPPLLLMQPQRDSVLITSRLNAWQLDGLYFFGFEDYRRLQISNAEGIKLYGFDSLEFVWNFDQIDRLHYMRSAIDGYRPCNSGGPLLVVAPDFTIPERIQRVSNPEQLAEVARQAGAMPVRQSKLSYYDKLVLLSKAKNIVCLPGSESINPFLFGHSSLRIIQLIPWPNELALLSSYSMLVNYRQLAAQLIQNVHYLYSGNQEESPSSFDEPRYFSPLKLHSALQSCYVDI